MNIQKQLEEKVSEVSYKAGLLADAPLRMATQISVEKSASLGLPQMGVLAITADLTKFVIDAMLKGKLRDTKTGKAIPPVSVKDLAELLNNAQSYDAIKQMVSTKLEAALVSQKLNKQREEEARRGIHRDNSAYKNHPDNFGPIVEQH